MGNFKSHKGNPARAGLFFLILFLFSIQSVAQYTAAVGARAGKFGSGLTMKYFFFADNASGFELMILRSKIANSGWAIVPFYEHQLPFRIPLIQLPLDFIAGIGMHVAYYPSKYYKIVNGNADY